jgi:hypothetical protein
MISNVLYVLGVILLICGALVLFGVIALGSASATGLLVVGVLFLVAAYLLSRTAGRRDVP